MGTTFINPHTHTDLTELTALTFHSQLIPEQTLVRLTPTKITLAEELALAEFGWQLEKGASVGFVLPRAIGFPAWPIVTDPDNAHHALNLVTELELVRRHARTRPNKVKTRIEELSGTLQATAPHFLPTFFEEITRIFVAADNLRLAKRYFRMAREVERAHNVAVDHDRHQQAIREFMTLGVVGAPELATEFADAEQRLEPMTAYEYAFNLALDLAKADNPLNPSILAKLKRLGKAAGKTAQQVGAEFCAEYVLTRSFIHTAPDIWEKLIPHVATACQQNPQIVNTLLTICPEQWDLNNYIATLQQAEIWESLITDPTQFKPWLTALFQQYNHQDFFATPNDSLIAAITRKDAGLAGLELNITAGVSGPVNLDYCDALVAAGCKLHLASEDVSVLLASWFTSGKRDLKFLSTAPELLKLLLASITACQLSLHVDKLLDNAATAVVVSQWLDCFAKRWESSLGSAEASHQLQQELEFLTDPRLSALNPTAMTRIFQPNLAEIFATRLRRGSLAEYTWPTFEAAAEHATTDTAISAYYPGVILRNTTQLQFIDGDYTKTLNFSQDCQLVGLGNYGDSILVDYYDRQQGYGSHTLWKEDHTWHDNHPEWHSPVSPETEQALATGGTVFSVIQPATSSAYARNQDSWPSYAFTYTIPPAMFSWQLQQKWSIPEFQSELIANKLPGMDTSFLDFHDLDDASEFRPEHWFYRRVTKSTKDSPLGTHKGYILGLPFSHATGGSTWLSPLGTFTSHEIENLQVIRRPSGGVWYLNGTQLVDAKTHQPIAPPVDNSGKEISLNRLPTAGFHQLHVRNQQASEALRACTIAQAQQLIDDPTKILAFVGGDEVLAAAIAGILTQCYTLCPSVVAPPIPTVVPDFLCFYCSCLAGNAVTQQLILLEDLDAIPQLSAEALRYLDNIVPLTATYQNEAEKLSQLAQYFLVPQSSDAPSGHYHADCISLIGREKLVLAHLSAPMIPVPELKELIEFFRWLVRLGVLGRLHRATVDRYTSSCCTWKNDILFLSGRWNEGIAVWDPNQVSNPHERLGELWLTGGADEFVPAQEFLGHLDEILAWREDLTEAQHAAYLANQRSFVEELAQVTSLPPGQWYIMLSGALTKEKYGHTFTAEVAHQLGFTASQLSTIHSFSYFFISALRQLRAAAWQADFVALGPNITAVAKKWEEIFGRPWLHLTDAHVLRLRQLRDFDVMNAGVIFGKDYKLLPRYRSSYQAFFLLIMLSQIIEPQSESVHALVERIELFYQYQPPEPEIALGGPYPDRDQPGKESLANQHAPRLLLEGRLDRLLDYLRHGPVPDGAGEDPGNSAPVIVQDVVTKLGLSQLAARYFLQLLALPTPTDTMVKQWNSWQKKQLDVARQELVDKQLVVSAKRTGTGRSVFLAGGWLEKTPTGPAMESWKAPHYLLWEDGRCRPIIPGCPVLLSHAELFAEVWERYISSDLPGYETLHTTPYRRHK